MRKLISFLLILSFLLSCSFSLAEASSSILVGEWYFSDGDPHLIYSLIFNEDGTGSAIAASQTINILSWTTEENKILFDYKFNGTLFSNDMYSLSVENGESVILFVDGDHQRIFRRIPADEPSSVAESSPSNIEDVTGTWTCRLTDSVATLTLNPDGSGALVIGNSTYSCAWRRSGPSFILYQNDIAIEGVYSGSTITLNLGGKILEFTH